MIGLYGTGGVGKTTLLRRINNEFVLKTENNSHFDAVIWVVVSKELNTTQIRKQIGDQLEIPRKEDKSLVAEATDIFRLLSLKNKKFFDIEEIRIPHPSTVTKSNNKSKVIFTTRSRSEHICGVMKAKKKFKVECLNDNEAWNLFQETVGEDTLNYHPDKPQLARDVVKERGGLPLALITIGRAMTMKKTPQEWEHAITMLQRSPAEISGMDEKIRDCFVYCSLFPEDFCINMERVIEYWIGKGFIKGYEEMREAMNEEYDIIATLKRRVKMHDVIRDMALWIVNEYGRNNKNKNLHLVVRYQELMDASKLILKWQGANRIFMLPPSPFSGVDDYEVQQINENEAL
uniref:NB-ARC domain-containing protein n=1 Tax=Nelumbo nucifera TaxID=4432 RepID=A0A822XYA3_NELNU|nr:TPA_asm: hypothetical protein HUJ06_026751 [Nelumbo nucifera]